ncbi:MAG: phosphatase PAP2 family protein [Bacteroidia bacterium]|nr:phosphatase PAP2 family protein [Bacteroidia bacterium]
MRTKLVAYFLSIALPCISIAQVDSTQLKTRDDKRNQVYNYNNKLDIALTSVAAAATIFNFTQIFTKDRTPEEDILALDREDVNGFDRRVAGNYNEKAKTTSDFFFSASIPLPLIVYAFDDKMRKDYLRLTLLYLEAMSITGVTYSTSQQLNNRLRPFTYNQDIPLLQRTSGGARNSFFSGHTALVATSTFFLASTWDDYHPDSDMKWVIYGGATLATVLTGHFRMRAGKHFPSDVIVGGLVGSLSGLLVPKLHKNKEFGQKGLSVLPVSGEYHGLRLAYRF